MTEIEFLETHLEFLTSQTYNVQKRINQLKNEQRVVDELFDAGDNKDKRERTPPTGGVAGAAGGAGDARPAEDRHCVAARRWVGGRGRGTEPTVSFTIRDGGWLGAALVGRLRCVRVDRWSRSTIAGWRERPPASVGTDLQQHAVTGIDSPASRSAIAGPRARGPAGWRDRSRGQGPVTRAG